MAFDARIIATLRLRNMRAASPSLANMRATRPLSLIVQSDREHAALVKGGRERERESRRDLDRYLAAAYAIMYGSFSPP